jgi:Uma2 family endonuclease
VRYSSCGIDFNRTAFHLARLMIWVHESAKLESMEKDLRAGKPKNWTREEYDKMIAVGLFAPEEKLELLEGEILQMTPQGSRHATAILLIHETLMPAFSAGHVVRIQMPLALDELSEPEPDIAIVPGNARDFCHAHPDSALLIIEVADSTLEFDRRQKSSIYAKAGIPEYWIINLIDNRIEAYRDPEGSAYRSIRYFTKDDVLSPLSAPYAAINTADLLP